MIDIKSAFATALGFARFFFRSPKDQAVENLVASGLALWTKVLTLPEFAAVENDFEAFLKAYGWGVTRDLSTNHIAVLRQPAGKWIMTQGGHLEWHAGE